MTIATFGIDLAKSLFALHGVDAAGEPVLVRPNVSRAALPALIAGLPPVLIGMEACSGAHHWVRLFQHGAPDGAHFVAPCRLSGKRGKEV